MVKTYLVTGGMVFSKEGGTTSYEYLSSTELLEESGEVWTLSGELPFSISNAGCASVDNRIFLAGFKEDK